MSRNFQGWSEKALQEKVKSGTLRSYEVSKPKPQTVNGKKVVKHFKKKSKEKDWIGRTLIEWTQKNDFDLYQEYRFSPDRNFRFDWAIGKGEQVGILDHKFAAVEYEGIIADKSGHTTITGYTKDVIKYNLAQSLGWKVIRLTALNYETLTQELNKLL